MDYVILFLIGVFATAIGTIAGGGGLVNLPAMLLLGIPVHSAIAANKVSNTISSFSSFYYLYKEKKLTLRESFWIIPVSLIGGISGGFIALKISSEDMYVVAIGLLIFAFIASFIGKGDFSGDERMKVNGKSVTGLYAIGIYDGLFGPGQGTLMFYLFGYLKIGYIRAVGYVRLATFSSCFGAAITYISTGTVIWPVTIALMLGSLTGAQIGVRLASKLQPRFVKPILRVMTIALVVQMLV
ncbi:sulfite exporter TauE/SafE family protein [Mesobacillus subterraneus]|uniref:Probable membrane transporter protein n=1 Tax=Mesobacillus subterraneus TaxID=285983 RepID=A0A3R9FWN2_9BACI|nr:sulfite exporter TauE/SafE family protein [Mesobacillus subterraneus]RSD26893.1 sulfite exporter TauE/SafE family protein [Mesobacillus subterraneus]